MALENSERLRLFLMVITTIGAITAITVFVTGKRSLPEIMNDQPQTATNIETNRQIQPDLPPPPPDIEAQDSSKIIIEEDELFPEGFSAETGCELKKGFKNLIVIKKEQEDSLSVELSYYLADSSGIEEKYYLNSESLSNATRSWLPIIMAPGRRLKIKYAVCGNGASKYLAYIQPLRAIQD